MTMRQKTVNHTDHTTDAPAPGLSFKVIYIQIQITQKCTD